MDYHVRAMESLPILAAFEPVVGPHPDESIVQITARVHTVCPQVGIEEGRTLQPVRGPADYHDGRLLGRLIQAPAVIRFIRGANARAPVVG